MGSRAAAHRAVGSWRIVEMETWDADAVELLGPALVELYAGGTGHLGLLLALGMLEVNS